MVELKTKTMQVGEVDGKVLQEEVFSLLKSENIRPAYLWSYGIKNCLMGLKFEEESLDLVQELEGCGYTFADPHKFLCEVSSKIYGKKVTHVKKIEGKILQLVIEED